jgi:cell wall assembly regulator SMI1
MTTTSAVNEAWDRILAWLEVNAPATALCINSPATTEEIAAAEQAVGGQLPPDLVAWWRRANGMRSRPDSGKLLPPSYLPYAIEEVLGSRRLWLQFAAETGDPRYTEEDLRKPAGSATLQFSPAFLPIARNGSGDDLFVDLRSGPRRGCVTEYNHEQGALSGLCWPNTAAMLADVANGLERGTMTMQDHIAEARVHGFKATGYLPRVTEDLALHWEPPKTGLGVGGG